MLNTHFINLLRELNAKLLIEIAKLRKKNTKIFEFKKENAKLKNKNAEIFNLKRKFTKIEVKKAKLKARITEFLK